MIIDIYADSNRRTITAPLKSQLKEYKIREHKGIYTLEQPTEKIDKEKETTLKEDTTTVIILGVNDIHHQAAQNIDKIKEELGAENHAVVIISPLDIDTGN